MTIFSEKESLSTKRTSTRSTGDSSVSNYEEEEKGDSSSASSTRGGPVNVLVPPDEPPQQQKHPLSSSFSDHRSAEGGSMPRSHMSWSSRLEDDHHRREGLLQHATTTTPSSLRTLVPHSGHTTSAAQRGLGWGTGAIHDVAQMEAAKVHRARRSMAVVWLFVSAAVAVMVYFITRRFETERFEERFEDDSGQLVQAISEALHLALGAMDFLALNVASYARATAAANIYNKNDNNSDESWPFVVVPDFAARAEKTRALTGATILFMFPFIQPEQRAAWESFTNRTGRTTVQDTLEFQQRQDSFIHERLQEFGVNSVDDLRFFNVLFDATEEFKPLEEQGTVGLDPNATGPFLAIWQSSPLIPRNQLAPYNVDVLSLPGSEFLTTALEHRQAVISAPYLLPTPEHPEFQLVNEIRADFYAAYLEDGEESFEPLSEFIYPILVDSPDWVRIPFADGRFDAEDHRVAGVLSAPTYWRQFFRGVLPEDHDGVILVFSGECSNSFTYEINGPSVRFIGAGDHHETKFDDLEVSVALSQLSRAKFRNQIYTGVPLRDEFCPFTIRLYPSSSLEEEFITFRPLVFCLMSVSVSLLAMVAFVLYDTYVHRRNRRVLKSAERTDAIVSTLLPAEIRERLYQAETNSLRNKDEVDDFADEDEDEIFFGPSHQGPLAELYPNASVVYVGIAGFTAWSSTREPGQVFELLESIYGRWDELAYKHNVMKIETVGDYYVAVAGLPEPRDDHMLAIARFARDVVFTFPSLSRKLEVKLGPDASDLKVRVGIHSGQITGGLLRGSVTRYQLFGDTVNTASLLLKTGKVQSIHMSSVSADLLREAGKEKWIVKRSQPVELEGKGSLETYWIRTKSSQNSSAQLSERAAAAVQEMAPIHEDTIDVDASSAPDIDEYDLFGDMDETNRLVEWNSRVLCDLLQQILAARDESTRDDHAIIRKTEMAIGSKGTVLEEFVEIIELPPVQAEDLQRRRNPHALEIGDAVQQEIRNYLAVVASMYRNNAFHNFQHACHVTASVSKLLSRIVQVDKNKNEPSELADLSGHSYGITSDPLTQFAVVLSAIIHDCDHPGVPNSRLVKEKTHNAVVYKEKSVAEQNSVDLCWKLLMSSNYDNLRSCIYHNKAELLRFRQLLVNVVMATDIVDKELGALRKARWNVAFSEQSVDSTPELDMNRKATIVLEHLIQASDVSHTMQHWDVYIEWNERFFNELYSTYKAGRADTDPSVGWYEGEIGFFDFYVIPLAKKLDKCGVFGVSSHEYLDYAQANRRLWVERGKDCVAQFLQKYNELEQYDDETIPELGNF